MWMIKPSTEVVFVYEDQAGTHDLADINLYECGYPLLCMSSYNLLSTIHMFVTVWRKKYVN